MAGRNLNRQRAKALDALSDDAATELARKLAPSTKRTLAATLLAGVDRDVRTLLAAHAGDARPALAAIVANDPKAARLLIATRWQEARVEEALGVVRSPGQQRR